MYTALQSTQAGGSKKESEKVKDKIIYPVTEVFNTFLAKCLVNSVYRSNLQICTKFDKQVLCRRSQAYFKFLWERR